jgi:peptidoglycan/xylan/chitin deacetylase (PgdA/CDA1 family)
VSRTDYRNIFSGIAGLFSIQFLRKLSGQFLIHPFYHAVSDNPPAHLKHLYPIKSISQFKADLDFYLQQFTPISPDRLLNKGLFKLKEPHFLLSFDDGLREVKDNIAPVLLEKGITAIFFINNDFIDNNDLFYRYKASLIIEQILEEDSTIAVLKEISQILEISATDKGNIIQSILNISFAKKSLLDKLALLLKIDFSEYLKKQKPYLTANEIIGLKNKGFFIGSHSFDHPDFAYLNNEDQIREVKRSAGDISEQFKLDYKYFAFPFTDYNVSKEVLREIHSAYNGIVDLSFGTAGMKKPEQFPHFQRIPVEKSLYGASDYLKSEYFYYLLKGFIRKNNLNRR